MSKHDLQVLIASKKKEKSDLQAKYWPTEKQNTPLILVFAPQKNNDLLTRLLEGMMVLPAHFILINHSKPINNTRIKSVRSSSSEIDHLMSAADMAVIFDADHVIINKLQKKGVVVIGSEKLPNLDNYHPNTEKGNSFTYASHNPWDIFMALVCANETYRFPYDWQNIIRGMINKTE